MSEPKFIEIAIKGQAEIAKMQPGDVLLVKFDGALTKTSHDAIREHFEHTLPAGVRVLIGERGFDFSILRPSTVNTVPADEGDDGSD